MGDVVGNLENNKEGMFVTFSDGVESDEEGMSVAIFGVFGASMGVFFENFEAADVGVLVGYITKPLMGGEDLPVVGVPIEAVIERKKERERDRERERERQREREGERGKEREREGQRD